LELQAAARPFFRGHGSGGPPQCAGTFSGPAQRGRTGRAREDSHLGSGLAIPWARDHVVVKPVTPTVRKMHRAFASG